MPYRESQKTRAGGAAQDKANDFSCASVQVEFNGVNTSRDCIPARLHTSEIT